MAKPKEDNEKNTEWIIAGNPDKYDIIGESQVLGSIDWTQSVKIAVGDIVYIYISNTVRAIKIKCKVNAVNKVNCVMEKGIYGLLGVNGAGKTTLMRMLCTIVQPSEGQILWNGKDIWKLGGEYREVLGYLPQDFGYYPDLTVYDLSLIHI